VDLAVDDLYSAGAIDMTVAGDGTPIITLIGGEGAL
jgi:hypothetical protein